MKKIKMGVLMLSMAVVVAGATPLAFAEDSSLKIDGQAGASLNDHTSVKAGVKVMASTTDSDKDNDSDRATSTDNEHATSTERGDQNRNATSTGSYNSEAHRSVVATFVQNLLKVADREPGIGAEVRVIAKEQNDEASTTVDAMTKVESRGRFAKLIIGSDYKNLGVLRSTLTKLTDRINRLQALASKTTDVNDKAELEAQVKVLQADEVKINAFIKLHEDGFSFLGWFVKLFNK